MSIKYIFFDCMETLIDLHVLPGVREYALWAFKGSGAEAYWKDDEEFIAEFSFMRKYYKDKPPINKEYDLAERLKLIIDRKKNLVDSRNSAEIIDSLLKNFWSKYKEQCYVRQEVLATVSYLAKKYQIGVVSNFLVKGGIQDLLRQLGLEQYIEFVVTSVDDGWRKPHENIYKKALTKAQSSESKIIFIGDDYLNDYVTPAKLGFKTIIYDKKGLYPHVADRFQNFIELQKLL